MGKIFFLCGLLFFNLCNAQSNSSSKRTIISGNLKLKSEREVNVMLRVFDNINPDIYPAFKVVQTTKRGGFKFELNLKNPVYIDLDSNGTSELYNSISGTIDCAFKGRLLSTYYNASILIEPGDSVCIDLSNCKNFCDIIFSGKGSEKQKAVQAIFYSTRQYDGMLSPTNLLLSDSVRNSVQQALSQFKNVLSPGAYDMINADYSVMLGRNIEKFIANGSMNLLDSSVKRMFLNRDEITSSSYLNKNNGALLYTDANVLSSLFYRAIIKYAIKMGVTYPKKFSTGEFQKIYFDAIKNEYSGRLRDKLLAFYIIWKVRDGGLNNDLITASKIFLKDNNVSQFYRKKVDTVVKMIKAATVKGTPAYPFSLLDTNNRLFTLKDFKGKVIVMDFMFNGCPACLKIVPYLTKVEEKFDSSLVSFVSVSFDPDIETWKEGIGKYSTSNSLQLFTGGKGIEDLMYKHYLIPGCPTLVIIDSNGKLITARGPDPRYDNGKGLADLLNEELKKKE